MTTPIRSHALRVVRIVPVVALLLLLVGAGCEEGGPTAPPAPIAVSAGAGTTPVYTWDGASAFSVSVARLTDVDFPVWTVRTPGMNGIASPLTHGTVPANAVAQPTTESTLTAGVGYRVTVLRLDGARGEADFTP